jgi:hypothetical protein
MNQERRGFRFAFDAAAETAPENSPSASIAVRAKELSLHGCYLETPAPFPLETRVFVKIFHEEEYFEAKGAVIYLKPASGMGVTFRDMNRHCRAVLQKWILAAMLDKTRSLDS